MAFLRDFLARGNSPGSIRSYAFGLLRWWRWLEAVEVEWDRATSAEVMQRALNLIGLVDRAGKPLHFTPHDFRRLFASGNVPDGLPLHIVSRLLGHKHLSSTRVYVAVFKDDLQQTYRAWVDGRRATRPPEEYRQPTEAE